MSEEKNKKHIEPDDLFREELNNRTFDFDEKAWQDAEQMIINAEKAGAFKKSRRGGWAAYFGWMLFLLIVVTGIVEVVVLSRNEGEKTSSSPIARTAEITQDASTADATSKNGEQQTANIGESSKSDKTNIRKDPEKAKVIREHLKQHALSAMKEQKKDASKKKKAKNLTATSSNINKDHSTISLLPGNADTRKKEKETALSNEQQKEQNTTMVADDASKTQVPETADNTMMTDATSNDVDSVAIPTEQNDFAVAATNNKTDSGIVAAPPVTKKQAQFDYQMGVSGGPDLVSKQLTNQNAPNDLIDRRTGEESNITAYSLQLNVAMGFNNWQIRSGLGYYQLGEQVDYNTGYTAYQVIYDTFENPIDTIPISMINDTLVSANGRNTLSYFEVPVSLGYSIGKAAWHLQLSAGISFGFLLNAKGNILDASLTHTTTLKEAANSIQYNLLIDPSLEYALNDKWRIAVQPVMRLNLNNALNGELGYAQKYSSYGLHIGLLYQF